jgi:peptidase M23-like protein
LLILKTLIRCVAVPFVVFLVWAPAANAWSWPVQGPVLRPFSYDEANPYAAGQHRGIDIGANAAGDSVVAPAAGTVTFAGTVPTNGESVTIHTADGYAVTLTHLGSILVAKGATLAEHDPVGTIGPSGTPEVEGAYVHLGIRVASDPNGYVDPLGLLPPAADSGGSPSDPTTSQPASSGASSSPSTGDPAPGSSSAPATGPAPAAQGAPGVSTGRGSIAASGQKPGSTHKHERTRDSRTKSRPKRTSQPEAAHGATSLRRRSRPKRPVQRPVVETAAPVEPTGLDAGHEIRSSRPAAPPESRPTRPGDVRLALLCNGAAALVALCAALAAARSRRRRIGTTPIAAGKVLHFPRSTVDRRAA